MVDRMDLESMLRLAGQGLWKVDRWGLRGVTLCSMEEVEAMALTLAALGLPPREPGAPGVPILPFTPNTLGGGAAEEKDVVGGFLSGG